MRRRSDGRPFGRSLPLLLAAAAAFVVVVCDELIDESWHIGCYLMASDDSTHSNNFTELRTEENPVACCQSCLDIGFLFAAVQQSDCFCLMNVSTETAELPQESCNSSCMYNVSDVVRNQINDPYLAVFMPCGGKTTSVVSVYRSSGPFLYSLSLSVVESVIYVGQAFVITIDLSFPASPDMKLNFGTSVMISPMLVYIQSFCDVTRLQTPQARSSMMSTDIICILEVEGNYTANVTASNILSELRASISFVILDPIISAVQVFLLTDHTLLPCCLPETELLNGTRQMVFEGIPLRFEASVHVCCESIVFNWTFEDANGRGTFSVLQDGLACHDGQLCSTSIQEYIFPTSGFHSVIVTASNNRSEASDRIELVVVTPGIRNLSFAAVISAFYVSEEVAFNVSLVTVIAQRVTLFVDFGDGDKRHLVFYNINQSEAGVSSAATPKDLDTFNYTMQEVTTSRASPATSVGLIPDWEELEMMGTFRFTEDCQILLTLEHVYLQEGSYYPTLFASDGFSNVSVSVSEALIIFSPLQYIAVSHSSVGAVNRSMAITAEPNVPSIFLSFHWQISSGNLLVFENVTKSSVLQYIFSDAGLYDITVNASNPSDFRINTSRILIEVPIDKLEVFCIPERFIALHEVLNCSAAAGSGTDIEFQWNFLDNINRFVQIWSLDLYSNARHQFHLVGEYIVSVQASNRLGKLSVSLPYKVTVLEPVYNLWTLLPHPVLLGETVEFVTSVESGSDFVIKFYFGDSSDVVIVNGTRDVNISLSRMYNQVGTYRVKVVAQNEVSVLKKEFDVDIVEDFSFVNISLVGPNPVTERHSAFVAYVDKELSSHEDLLYNWTKDGEILNTTQFPVYRLVFDSVAVYNVSVTVFNMIVSKSDWMIVNVTDDHLDFFITFDKTAVAFGSASTLNLVNIIACEKLTIDYGDKSDGTELNSTELGMRLEHLYNEPGAYIVVARCDYGERSVVAMTAVAVQQMITSVTLIGPDETLFRRRLNELWKWQAIASSGSNIVYQWQLDDVPVAVTAKNKVYLTPPIGYHTLTVTAANGLGGVSTDVSFVVQRPVISVLVSIHDVVLGADTKVVVSVVGGREYNVTCYFGDGTFITNSSESLISINLHETWNEEFLTDTLVLSHKYSSIGVYSVMVYVADRVSRQIANSTVQVFEPVGDISLRSSSPSTVESGSVVVTTAVTKADYALVFNWNSQGSVCPSDSRFDGNIWESTANCSLSPVFGQQIVVVNVSSAIADNWKLANITFSTVDPIEKLVLSTSLTNPTESAILRQNSTYPGQFYTDPVKFEARMDRGSEVVCKFDFGDNSTSLQSTFSEVSGPVSCVMTHVFRKVGVYTVSVIAYNHISSLSVAISFYVQVQPSGLHLVKDPEPYHTQRGQPVSFIANISHGTDVSYTWTMGDGQVYSPAGQNVTHHYLALGCFHVTVMAFNRVGRVTIAPPGRVFVQDNIQSVELVTSIHPTLTGIVVRSGASVNFTAIPHPNMLCIVDAYEWKPTKDQKDERDVSSTTVLPQFSHMYEKLGVFSATVTARNALGSLTSEPLIVTVMDELRPVTIQIRGEIVVNSQIEFDAYHFAGSSVSYLWNFGDNTTAISTVSSIKHSYSSVGVFTVSVNASNAVSQEISSETIFVTTTFCKPPAISFLGPNNIEYLRSNDIRVEALVDLNCSITNDTIYEWTVTNTESGLRIYYLEPFMLHDPLLILPKMILSNGNYSVQLRVTMSNTIVYGEAKTVHSFSITSSPLQAVIQGGLMRNVSYSQYVILDGSQSYDPDSPEDDGNNFTYSWSCLDYKQRDKTCFTDSQLSVHIGNSSDKMLNISGSAFRFNATDFLIQLNISKPGREVSSVQQLLTFQEQPVIHLSIKCKDCANYVANSNDQLIFEAVHFGFEESELKYKWTLSDIKGTDSNSRASATYQVSCFPLEGNLLNLHMNGSTYNSSQFMAKEAANPSSEQQLGVDFASTVAPGDKVDFSSSTSQRASTSVGHGAGGGLIPFSVDEQPSLGRRRHKLSENGGNMMPPVPIPEEGNEQSSERRPKASKGKGPPSSASSDANTKDDDPAIDQRRLNKEKDIFTDERNERRLLTYETTTGINQKFLIVNAHTLTQGLQYLVKVTVTNKWSNVNGTSTMYFYVNKSPSRGECRMKSDSAKIDLQTEFSEFSVLCFEWKDHNKPISYEINYRLSMDSQPILIYRGLSNVIKFHLPAGNPDNYTVIVEVAAINSIGARSTVCIAPVTVHPAITDEQMLSSAASENGTVNAYVQKGRNIQARLSAFMIARQLNRQSVADNITEVNLTTKIRSRLLSYIEGLPIRDVFELQQTVLALAEIVKTIHQINEDGARYARNITQRLVRKMVEVQAQVTKHDRSCAELAIFGASNLISWVLHASDDRLSFRRSLLLEMTNLTEILISIKARLLLPGMKSVNQSTAVLSTTAAHFDFYTDHEIFLDSAILKFPFLQNLSSRVYGSKMPLEFLKMCFRSAVILYKQNPFIFGPRQVEFIATNVVSVTMYACNGSKLDITALTKNQALDVSLPNQMYNNASGGNASLPVYQLGREFMNVHNFTLTSSDWSKESLHIDIRFLPLPSSVDFFPVRVYVQVDLDPSPWCRVDLNPSPLNCFQWDILSPNVTSSYVINLTALKMIGDRVFSVCLAERTLNAVRPRPAHAEYLDYQIGIWWGQCLYWDVSAGDWSTAGCTISDSSLFENIRCRCTHLTSFGANVLVYPSKFKQYNIRNFFNFPMNPLTCSFVLSLLLFYFILLFVAYKLDTHDVRKLPVISLVDNSPKDRQRYYITLETGFRRGAGTSAKVSVVLHGEYGMSETRELISQTGQPLFERNSRDTFYMTLPESLGSIFKVQLWHDNSGPFPSWYLSRVTVKDACTDDIYHFVCEKWFAVEKEDGKVEREIMVADKGLSFSKILSAKSMQYLTDYHLWFSTLVKPSYSRFTRAQRLTCCLCLLMSSTALSAAWYQYVGPPYRSEFNLIDISWQSIIVGMIVGLTVLPPTLLIILIFRRSKVYRHSFEETSEEFEGNELTLHNRLLSDAGGVTAGLSVFEQTILSWQSLQEWAQKAPAKHYQQSPVGSVQNVKPVAVQNFEQDHSSSLVDREPVVAVNQHSLSNYGLHKCDTILEGNSALEPVSDVVNVIDMEPTCDKLSSTDVIIQHNVKDVSDTLRIQDPCKNDVMEIKNTCQPTECSNVLSVERGIEDVFDRKEAKRMGFRRSKGSNCNISPSSSYVDSSQKEIRLVTHDEGCSEECESKSLPTPPLQPPSYGVIFQSPGTTSRSYSQGSNSNRSSVKSASSNFTKVTNFKKWRQFLPHYFVYIGWGLCVLLVAGCSAVTIYYGFRFSEAQSILWLQSVFFSFLQCIFISHPLIVLTIMLYSAAQYQNDMRIFDHYNDGLIHDRDARQTEEKKEKTQSTANRQSVEQKSLSLEEGIAARQRSRYLRFARPPQEQRLIQARHQTMKERNASALVNETVLFVGQFLLLVFIAFGKESETSYQLKASLTKSFVNNRDMPFKNITSMGHWWHWVNNNFLEVMYSEEGYVDNCLLIGPVILRQLRVKDVKCYIESMSELNFRCRDSYSHSLYDTDDLIINGMKYEHTNAGGLNSYSLDGLFGSYVGGGYIIEIDRLKAEEQLRELQRSNWTDQFTSAVILQFTLFHPQTNLFATVSLILELPPLGVTFTSNHISIVYLYKYITAMDNLVLACELLFFLATLLKIHHEIVQVLRHGINYLKNIWNVLEVSQCLLSLALIVCYTYRFLLIDSLVEEFRSTHHEKFVDVSNLAYWDMVLRALTGFVLLLVNLQLVKGLRHHQPFARFANVYNHTSLDFVVFGCMFVIWLGAFISLGIALFGGVLWEMTTVSQALGYMTGLLECSYEFPLFKGLSPSEIAIWEAYTMSFLILAYGSIAGYLLAFLTFHYRVFKDEPVLVFSPRENMAFYCQKVIDFFKGKSSNAYDAGKQQEIVLPPEFTMAEIQYQVDEMVFKMNALAGTSNLPEKPAMYFTDSDTTCIGNGEELSSSGGSSAVGNFENLLHRMKDNLFRNDSHFAQLVNCDSQTTKQDNSKQLMLQLEMEILRQLQGKRSSSNHPSESSRNSRREGARGEGGESAIIQRPHACHGSSVVSSNKSSASPFVCHHNRQLPLPASESFYGNQSEHLTTSNTVGVKEFNVPLSTSTMQNDQCIELNDMSQHYDLQEQNYDSAMGHNLISSNETIETEFGNDIIRQLLVPEAIGDEKNQPVDNRIKWKFGKVQSLSDSKSAGSTSPSPTAGRIDTKDVFQSLHFPLQTNHHLDDCEVIDDVFIKLVEEDVFGFENEGYAIESSEDSDQA